MGSGEGDTVSEATSFRIVRHGYDPDEVDRALAQVRRALTEARSAAEDRTAEVTRLRATIADLRRTLAFHHLRVAEEPVEEAGRPEEDNISDADRAHSLGDDAVESALTAQDEDLPRG